MTIWTSSAPTTPTVRCHRTQLNATCCTWWRGRTTRSVNLTPSTSSVGSARGLSLPTLLRSSLRNSSVLLPSPWEKSSDRERAIIISVSVNNSTGIFLATFHPVSCIKHFPLFWLSAAKPMHHHGQDCLRMRVDVVGHKGSGNTHLDKSKADNTRKSMDGGKGMFPATGGVHNPSNRLPAGEESSLKIPHEIVRAVSCLSRSSAGCV